MHCPGSILSREQTQTKEHFDDNSKSEDCDFWGRPSNPTRAGASLIQLQPINRYILRAHRGESNEVVPSI